MATAVKRIARSRAEAEEAPPPHLYRFSVQQYERMVGLGILTPDDRGELLEGWIVQKMTQYPPHAVTVDFIQDALRTLLPQGWRIRDQKPIRLTDSVPEPDLTIVRGPLQRYLEQHPQPRDIALVIEVADTSLAEDRKRKGRLYARARLPIYWIVNLVGGHVEVYTRPKGGKSPGYRDRRDYTANQAVPLVIEGTEVGQLPVSQMIPKPSPEENDS